MSKKQIITALCALALPSLSQAVPLSGPNVIDIPLNGTTVAERPELAGVVVLEDLLTPFSISGAGETLSGLIQNRVVRSVDGTLDFYWRIRPDAGSGDVSSFRLLGFENASLDADWRIDGSGEIGPAEVRYFGDGSGAVNFQFSPEVGTDFIGGGYNTSKLFFLDTDATSYDMSGSFDLLCASSGCVSQVYSTFAPSAVPVPAAVWLFGSGLLGLVGVARRNKS